MNRPVARTTRRALMRQAAAASDDLFAGCAPVLGALARAIEAVEVEAEVETEEAEEAAAAEAATLWRRLYSLPRRWPSRQRSLRKDERWRRQRRSPEQRVRSLSHPLARALLPTDAAALGALAVPRRRWRVTMLRPSSLPAQGRRAPLTVASGFLSGAQPLEPVVPVAAQLHTQLLALGRIPALPTLSSERSRWRRLWVGTTTALARRTSRASRCSTSLAHRC